MVNDAELYNKCRHHVFSTYNKYDIDIAYACLFKYEDKLDLKAMTGLVAELEFYHKYKKELTLDLSLDAGNKCDFIGNIEGQNNCRIDVTTNIDYKHLSEYEPIQKKDNRFYKVVIVDKDNGEIKDIVDLNFPFSKNGGRLFDIAIFEPQDYNFHGDPRNNPWQRIITVDSYNPATFITNEEIMTDWYLPDIHSELSNMYDSEVSNPEKKLEHYLVDAAKLLSKTTNRNIVACGQLVKKYNGQTDEEEVFTKLYWRHPVITSHLGEIIWDEI